MSSFTTPLVISPLPDGKNWKLVEPFGYYEIWRDGFHTGFWQVATGFVTDFASTPWFIWWMFPPWGKYGQAAVLHDWLYRERSTYCSRKRADKIFYDAMLVCQTKKWKAKIIYYSVRLFGWKAWKKYKTKG